MFEFSFVHFTHLFFLFYLACAQFVFENLKKLVCPRRNDSQYNDLLFLELQFPFFSSLGSATIITNALLGALNKGGFLSLPKVY